MYTEEPPKKTGTGMRLQIKGYGTNQSTELRSAKPIRATLPQIAADFNDGPPTSLTLRTIQRNIIDMGFRSRRPTLVPLLTARHKALRLSWTVDDWKPVAWSDESRFQLNRAYGCVRVGR
ncbi:HTH_Tnp_Tc3_2 domain-containing protein [Trichonephila clavipes]|nr:HTH_Tnp_Tc3_2 domain-containing protein [Trichonephila clavipes]